MTCRFQALWIALLAIPGLLGGKATIVVHEHDGGSVPHVHAEMTGHVGHPHPHVRGPRDAEPAASEESPVGEGSGDDGDRHGHYQDVPTPTLRRTMLAEGCLHGPAGFAWVRVVLAHEQPKQEGIAPPPSPGDVRGHPPSRTNRVIDRLVQGLGLLI